MAERTKKDRELAQAQADMNSYFQDDEEGDEQRPRGLLRGRGLSSSTYSDLSPRTSFAVSDFYADSLQVAESSPYGSRRPSVEKGREQHKAPFIFNLPFQPSTTHKRL
jgi:hypothetical protein